MVVLSFTDLNNVANYINSIKQIINNPYDLIDDSGKEFKKFINVDKKNLTISIDPELQFMISYAVLYSACKTVWRNSNYYTLPFPIETFEKGKFYSINDWVINI